jgi:hypothetical protein
MGFYSLCGIGCFLVMKKGLQDMSSWHSRIRSCDCRQQKSGKPTSQTSVFGIFCR